MQFIQEIKNVTIKPRKIREVVRSIKNRPLDTLKGELTLFDKSVNQVLIKGIEAAEDRIKNASQDPNEYIIKRIICNEGLKLRRRFIGSRGRSYPLLKQRSNINIVVGEKLKEPIAKTKKTRTKPKTDQQ